MIAETKSESNPLLGSPQSLTPLPHICEIQNSYLLLRMGSQKLPECELRPNEP